MSVCGGCPYPYEAELSGEACDSTGDYCGYGCSYEDAASRAQWAYDRLNERYEELEKEHELLKAEFDILKHKYKALGGKLDD